MEKTRKRIERITPDRISKRKFELFKRDPLAREMDTLYRKLHDNELDPEDSEKITDRLLELEKILPQKWNCYLSLNKNSRTKPLPPEPFCWLDFHSGHSQVVDLREHIKEELLPCLTSLTSFEQEHLEQHGWIFIPGIGGYQKSDRDKYGTCYVPVPPWSIPILIDIGGITKKDKALILKQVWDILEPTMSKRKAKSGRWKASPQIGDPPELVFLYKLPEEEFQNYLRWYDQHMNSMENKPWRKRFRNIAFHEFLREARHEEIDQGLSIIDNRKKSIRSTSGEKVIRGFIGEHLHKEDKVGYAIKVIYEAIHRKPYPKKSKQEVYNCPDHGNKCPKSCPHLKSFMRKFNKKNMLFKALYTTGDDPTPRPSKGKRKLSSDKQFEQESHF